MPTPDRFDPVFASYVEAIDRVRGRLDSEVRAPAVFARVWDELGCRPERTRTILVTGSKGKGTVARLVAWNLQRAGRRVGLVTSPEEIEHFDRIRIDDQPIPARDFDRLLANSLPLLHCRLAENSPQRYLSPTGIFLTVALQWFAEQGLDWIVVEGGRGVRWDEIGQLQARLAVVTSVLPEHVAALGGSFQAVVQDKMSIASQADLAVLGPSVASAHSEPGMPAWFAQLCAIASHALRLVEPEAAFTALPTPSFAALELEGKPAVCEALVSGASIDPEALRHALPADSLVVLGLSDDKDVAGILARLKQCRFDRFAAFELRSDAGYVTSRWLVDNPRVQSLGTLDVVHPDTLALRSTLKRLAQEHPGLYIAGVQLFMRSVRLALNLRRAGA